MFHTRWSDYLEISTQKILPKTSTLVHTPPEYMETIPKDISSLLNASQDDATSSEVGTLGGPDGNWQPRSSGSALTPCYNEMLFSFECLHPPPELRNEIYYLS